MSRWLPYPLLSLFLLAMWLALNGSLAPGQLLLGALLAVCGGWMLAGLQPAQGRLKRLGPLWSMAWLVLADIVRSNLAVARLVVFPRSRERVAGFIELPLVVRHPWALAILACIITATPGTSWARYDRARNAVTIHVFDLIDEDEWIRTFKERYERRLIEVFE